MPRGRSLLPLLICLALLLSCPAHADTAPQAALAMHGAPKYGTGFTHFDYVNPDAPKGGVLKLGATGTFNSLNPFIVRGDPALGLATGYLSLLYEPLMSRSWDEPFTLYGLIAETVEVPDDRSSITFNLNPAAHFSDGQPITADDVLFSYQTLRDKGRPNHRTYYKKVATAEKLSDRRIKFTFKPNMDGSIDKEMPLIMGLMPVLPAHDWKDRDFNQTTLRIPIGSGPYKIVRLDPGRSITYERDSDYWGRDLPVERGLYNFDTVHIDYYRDDGIALEAFKAGQYDLRRESNATKWTTSYDFPAVTDGRVKLEKLEHHRTEPAYGFVFNTRREPFRDPAFRAALEYSFDSGWINRNIFHGLYKRVDSFFPNSELVAPPLPEGKELTLLEPYKSQLPPEIFTTPVKPPETDGSEASLRTNLLKAEAMLRAAGYTLKDDQLYAPHSTEPVSFEILLGDPAEEKLALTWTRALKRLGVAARVHTVDASQFQARMAAFNYDVTTYKWINTLSPGNEQIFFWGSDAADQQGSRNYAGVHDPVVDALANAIPAASSRDDLVMAAHALDRVLMAGHYVVPFYYLGADDIASWAHFHHPAAMPLYGTVLETWWYQ
jgi:microcin C transport system substrate-binding protein